jgi:hypothetical protein
LYSLDASLVFHFDLITSSRYLGRMKYLLLLCLAPPFVACSTFPQREGVIKLQHGSSATPLINVQVDGQDRIVTLDSGTNILFLKPLSTALNLDSKTSEINSADVFGPKVKSFSVAKVDFKVGPLELRNIRTHFSSGLNFEAIPLSLIKSAQMIFDFPKSEIKMGEAAIFCEPKSQFQNVKGFTYVRISIGEEKHWLLWDTGATTSVLQESLEKKYGWTPSKEMAVNINSPAQKEPLSPTKFFVASIQIAGHDEDLYFITRDLTKVLAAINKNSDGILGYNFIRKYKWYFDFDKGKYCFAKN